ncbi:YihY/virulence factor BrkB family protein [Streptomyces hoynatensis]|uniref:YihY/virulence factor BrkB family protein n=1 Tax=Streptomyces hoynatensis TaxID=1141874 RepID=A0A3A9ZGP0_9ACTN|nr:YihY/virulence factor BrkB family protein [Streptomyces hoynatensis]
MDWLTRLPWIGPLFTRFFRSRVWRVYRHLDERAWTRLAAAITFTSFVTLFPVLGLAAALGAWLLTDHQLGQIQDWISDQVPGISDQLELHAVFAHSHAIGIVSLILVLPTGASWVDAVRGCLRALWDLPDPEENPLLRRAKDVGVLAGLGALTLLSLTGSAFALSFVRTLAGHGAGSVFIQTAAYLGATAVTYVLLSYVLVWLPGVRPPPRSVAFACLLGAVGFEVLKLLIGGYLTEVATRNLYGAFGVPVALLVWINLMAKLLLFCSAWTATSLSPRQRPRADALDAQEGTAGRPGTEAGGDGGTDTPPGSAPPDPPR